MAKYKARWIVYLESPIPGNFDIVHANSIELAKKYLAAWGKDTGLGEQVSGTLYPYTAEDWAEAMEFANSGCPFDYPTYTMEYGPKGGIRMEKC